MAPIEALLMRMQCLIRSDAHEEALDLAEVNRRKVIAESSDAQRAQYEMYRAYLVGRLESVRNAAQCYSVARAYVYSAQSEELLLEVLGWQARSAAYAGDYDTVQRFTEILLERGGASNRVVARSIKMHTMLARHDLVGQLRLTSENDRDLANMPHDNYLKAINILNLSLLESQIGDFDGVIAARRSAENLPWTADLKYAEAQTFACLADGAAKFNDSASEASAMERLRASSDYGFARAALSIRETRKSVMDGRVDRVIESLSNIDDIIENGQTQNSLENESELMSLLSVIAAINVSAARYIFEKMLTLKRAGSNPSAFVESRFDATRRQGLGMIQFFSGDYESSRVTLEPAFFHFLNCGMSEPTASIALLLGHLTGSDYYLAESGRLSGMHPDAQTERRLRFFSQRICMTEVT